ELQGRYIDSDSGAGAMPSAALAAGLLKHPLPYAHDEPGFLRDWNKPVGRDHAQLGMLPSQKRLGADYSLALQVKLRLIVENQLLPLQRAAEIVLQFQTVARLRAHFGVEEHESILPPALRVVHCEVRLAL